MLVLLLAACSAPVDEDPPPAEGFLVVDAARGNLTRCLAAFPESPASATAAAWAAAPCTGPRSAAWTAEGLQPAACAAPSAAVEAWRKDAAVAFAMPSGEAGRLAGRLTPTPAGGFHLEVRAPMPPEGSPLRLAVPAATPRAAALLSDEGAAMHARMTTAGGIDIASMVPPDSQGAQLFGLKSSLLSGAVLDGSWEIAVYAPKEGGVMPRIALGLGVRGLTADAALDTFMEQLRAQWSVHRAPITAGDWKGECVSGLKVMPDFEPCYLRKDDALVIGWNRSAAELGAAPAARAVNAPSGVSFDFAALAAADAVFARAEDPRWLVPPIDYPLGRIDLTVRANGDHQLVLEGDSARGCAR
jgi:hypothetical protein